MKQEKVKSCAIIGSGIAGIAAALRMRKKGYRVTVFEANTFPGGKLSQETVKGYRFDMGPSVFTMPSYVDELFELYNKNPKNYFNYIPLNPVFRYFFEDGTVLDSMKGKEAYSTEMAKHTNDFGETIKAYLSDSENVYNLTEDIFLNNSLHKIKNYFTKSVVKGLINFKKIGAFATMNEVNEKSFVDEKLVQIFNRYATYNGSSPYLAPATLKVISHVEISEGAFYPVGGVHNIVQSLVQLAKDVGEITFRFSTFVKEIVIENKKVKGIRTDKGTESFDVVISNMDVYNTYNMLMPGIRKPIKTLNQPKSSSAMIFYWGIKKEFNEIGLHTILFSENYKEEFDFIFNKKLICNDPTIYINITSKYTKTDTPEGHENWFTMINSPHNVGQDWDKLIKETRKNVIAKINKLLKTNIEPLIECEMIFDARVIESRTQSFLGAIYGNSSNNKLAAFLRHPNFSKEIKNLYFCGGSVHPGPSIPLCLLSAKIATSLIN